MKNTEAVAKKWTEFLASRPEFACGSLLREQFAAGKITRLCDCGCNGYEFSVAPDVQVTPLTPASTSGSLPFQMAFQTSEPETSVELLLFVDERGNLSGLDVDCCGNTQPMPEQVSLMEPPYHVHGTLAQHV